MPNLYKRGLTAEEREFYFKALLVLFKPHDFWTRHLLGGFNSYEIAYTVFANDNSIAATDAKLQDSLFTNYHFNEETDIAEAGMAEEDVVFQNHPFAEQENDPRRVGSDAWKQYKHTSEEASIVQQLMEDGCDERAVDTFLNISPKRAELSEEIRNIFDISRMMHPGNKLDEQLGNLPAFNGMRAFKKALLDPTNVEPEHNRGTTMFTELKEAHEVKIKMVSEFFEPVPWTGPHTTATFSTTEATTNQADKIASLRKFDSIHNISVAMQLNFWQHNVFETYARHLMHKWLLDIRDTDAMFRDFRIPASVRSQHIKTQLIGYVGGIAGSGKSSVIAALLTFARLWGRRDTVETVSFTGLASLQIDGTTIHKARALSTYGCVPRDSEDVKRKVTHVYLTIIDEISMLGQKLCGSADSVTRFLRGIGMPWGGIDIMLCGDFFQLPPVKDISITKQPTDRQGSIRYQWYLAAYNLFQACNYVVFLTDNMRQINDPLYADILERMHWGVNTQEDIDMLNTRSLTSGSLDIEGHYRQYEAPEQDYFTPMAISRNKDRCGYNLETIYAIARKERVCVYEILAHSSNLANRATIQRLKYSDDDFTDKIPFLFSFHTNGMPAMITKRIVQLEVLNCIANGTLGFIIGYADDDSIKMKTSPNIIDDDSMFWITTTEDNITIKRFKKPPAFLLFKVRGCKRRLVKGYPIGVVPIPLASYNANFRLPGATAKTTMAVTTFPIIPAYAMTPEKLQGVTLEHELFVSELENRSPQILYVVHSRVRALVNLILTQLMSLEYVRKFLPNLDLVYLVSSLIDRIELPAYMPPSERTKFAAWVTEQKRYASDAIQLHQERRQGTLPYAVARKKKIVADTQMENNPNALGQVAATSSNSGTTGSALAGASVNTHIVNATTARKTSNRKRR